MAMPFWSPAFSVPVWVRVTVCPPAQKTPCDLRTSGGSFWSTGGYGAACASVGSSHSAAAPTASFIRACIVSSSTDTPGDQLLEQTVGFFLLLGVEHDRN